MCKHLTEPKYEHVHKGTFQWHGGGLEILDETVKIELTLSQNLRWITMQDQTIKMKAVENIFSKGRSTKLVYEMLINNITDNKYKTMSLCNVFVN